MKIILCRGLPGSGKSFWAKAQIDKHPDRYKRINRDDLRSMIDNGKWSKGKEKIIRLAELALAEMLLSSGYQVIVDDCNLSPSAKTMWQEFALKMKATVEIKDFTDVPLETCLERDKQRPNYVGEQVIRKMYRDFLQPKPVPPAYVEGLPDIVICDLDGTLALLNGRSPYDASTCDGDLVNEPIRSILANCGAYIILVSGRSEEHRPQTERWLQKHAIPYTHLYMRKEGDNRKDAIVKLEIYQAHISGKYNTKYILDDRQQVVDLWRSLGLTVLQVADGDY